MKFIRFKEENPERAIVTFIHNYPDMLSTEEKIDGLIINEDIPETPEPMPNKAMVLYVNPKSKKFWYEYVDRPETPDEKITRLEQENKTMSEVLDFLIMNTPIV